MALTTCSQCGKEFDEEELLCPHCGTAQIPQMSKAEVRMQALKASHGPYGFILLGTGMGLLLGAVMLVIALARGTATLQHGAAMLLTGMLGGAAGLAFHQLRLRAEAKRPASEGQQSPDRPPPSGS